MQPRSGASQIVRAVVIVAVALALAFGVPPLLRALNLHDWSKQTLGQYGFYELYIACGFGLVVVSAMAMWRAGLPAALRELGIAELSPLGCVCCLGAIAVAFGVLLYAGAKWTPQPWDSLLVFCFIGPFVEEVLFRGFIFRQLRHWVGVPFWIAAVISSLLFGAGHFDQGHSLADAAMNSTITFAGGVLFCWLVERWGSIWPGFVIHAGLNFLWSVYTLGDNAVGGAMGNVARVATVIVALVLTRLFAPGGALTAESPRPSAH
ncbi:MAG TPA: CPBP family intramembrane glutamic endopeptidase [Rhizomicrobium sp.]|nr:CPBP family intramembrane glutamic endopeptidase [Rhizomicrobium sp.]